MKTPSIAAVIFDMNGVLVDDEPIHRQAFGDIMAGLGREISDEDYARACLGLPDRDGFETLLADHPNPPPIEACILAKRERYLELIRENPPAMPGAAEVVRALHAKGLALALATGATRLEADLVLACLGIAEFFRAVASVEDTERGKPAPDIFLLAAKRLCVPPEHCLVVEDAPPGIRAARAAGMRSVGITSSFPREVLAEADMVLEDLRELPDLVCSIARSKGTRKQELR